MRLSIRLYSTDTRAASPCNIEAAIRTVDFSSAVQVSRTVGPANWFAINTRLIEGGSAASPPKDISYVRHTEPAGIAALARDGSVLSVSYDSTKSQRLGALSQAIGIQVPKAAQGFFWSSAWFTFGPSDIVEFTEDEDVQDTIKLVAVAFFDFVISCDNYPGQIDLLASSLDAVPEFDRLRDDLQRIVGPLTLKLS